MGNFVFLAPLFLYFPRIIPGVETQPVLALAITVYGLVTSRDARSRLAFAGLAVCLFVWALLRLLLGNGVSASLSLMQLLVGPAVMFGVIALRPAPPGRKVLAVVTLYFVAAGLLEILAPGVYEAVASVGLDRASVTDGHRGISVFTPEPTYAAISLVYFLFLASWSRSRNGAKFAWIEWALGLVLLATLSTYLAVFGLALAIALRPWTTAIVLAALVAAVPLLGVFALDNDDSIRAVVALSRLVSSDFSDFLPSISLLDSSIGSRILTNVASFETPANVPWGLGLACSSVPDAFVAAKFDFAFSNPVLSEVIDNGCLKPQSYAAAASLGLGSLALIFFVALCAATRFAFGRIPRRLWRAPFAIAIAMLLVQVQLTSPIPWLLLYLAVTRHGAQREVFRVAAGTQRLPDPRLPQ